MLDRARRDVEEVLIVIIAGLLAAVAIVGSIVFGVVHSTKMKIKHGYPLESMWGKPLHPQSSAEAAEHVRQLTHENAELRAELGSLRERMGNVEGIVTDSSYRLGHEIERLRDEPQLADKTKN